MKKAHKKYLKKLVDKYMRKYAKHTLEIKLTDINIPIEDASVNFTMGELKQYINPDQDSED